MAVPRDDVHDHLLAVIEAAPELGREERSHLADVFLDELESRYRLVPRRGRLRDGAATINESLLRARAARIPIIPAVLAAVFFLPLLLIPLFILGHVPFLLPLLLFFLVVKFGMFGMRRRRYPPPGGWV